MANLQKDLKDETLSELDSQLGSAAQSDGEIINHLASLSPLEYGRIRAEQAKALNVSVSILDKAVKASRPSENKSNRLPFPEVEPYPEAVDPAQLLNEISDIVRQFIVLDIEQAHAAALWIALTWFIDVVEVAPLAIVNAPEKACGKTQLLTVLSQMSYRPLPAANASVSALFRAIEAWRPTVIIDEADTFFAENNELHGMINAGYSRANGFILRCEAVGDNFEPKSFNVFAAKALAGINLEKHLPDATMSRGIVFNLRRKLSHESVNRLRYADRNLFKGITEKLARFASDYSQQVQQARPNLPEALSDRDQDSWESLFAIASVAGGEWLSYAVAAALKLSSITEKAVSIGNELLADICHAFEKKRADRIKTADLITELCVDPEAPWSTYNKGKPITPRQVSRLLKTYGITSKTIRLHTETPKGFELSQFEDAFTRYLAAPENLPPQHNKPSETSQDAVSAVADYPQQEIIRHTSATAGSQPAPGCGVVADKLPVTEIVKASSPNISTLRI